MAEVVVKDEIRASAQAVWDLVKDFGGLQRWMDAINSCEVEGEGVGAVRTLGLQGASLRERLEAYDEATRTFSYSILDGPLPVQNYVATLKVMDRGADHCGIEWASQYEPAGAPDEQVRGIIQGVYTGGIAAIKKRLEKD